MQMVAFHRNGFHGNESMSVASHNQRTQAVETVRTALNVPKSISIDTKVEGPFTLAKSKHLFLEGDDASHIFFLLDGTMKACCSVHDGDEMVVRFFHPGDVLLTDVFHTDKRTTTVSALEPCMLCSIPSTTLEELISNSKQVQKACYRLLSRLIKQEQHFLSMLAQSNADERVCCFLLHVFNQQKSGSPWLYIPMSRTDIANYLGLATETVSRTFSKLYEEAIVRSDRQTIEVLDYQRLNTLARGGCEYKREAIQALVPSTACAAA